MSALRARLGMLVLLSIMLPAGCSLAEEDPQVAMVVPAAVHPASAEAVTAKECGACHIPYVPGTMPARSWSALTSHLSTHFGEDASLDPATTRKISQYLTAHAADTRYGIRNALSGLSATSVPERITDMPWWQRRHRRLVARGEASGTGIRPAAQCQTCHGGHGAVADED